MKTDLSIKEQFLQTGPVIFIFWIAVMTGLFSCTEGYKENDKGEITYDGDVVQAHGKLKRLSEDFAVDSLYVYYHNKEIEGAHIEGFKVLDEHFAKDGSSVFYCDDDAVLNSKLLNWGSHKQMVQVDPIEGADAASFEVIGNDYARDRKRAYYKQTHFSVDRADSLVVINTDFVKTGRYVYYQTALVKGSDARSFALCPGRFYATYAKDRSRAYYYNHGIHKIECDAASFVPIASEYAADNTTVFFRQYPLKGLKPRESRLQHFYFCSDKNLVYFGNELLKGMDAATFSVCTFKANAGDHGTYFSKDAVKVFYEDRQLPGADPATFTVLDEDYAKDKNRVYYHAIVLKDADAATFMIDPVKGIRDKKGSFDKDKRL